jgi:hypothetical protein
MSLIPLNLVFEDQVSEFVMLKLIEKLGKFKIQYTYSEGGFGYIKKNIKGFNEASKYWPFFILTDLDTVNCAPELKKNWLKVPQSSYLIFRIAVREVEAWLLADIEGFSCYTGVSQANFNKRPEELSDPKQELLKIVKRCRNRNIKEDILPKDEFAICGPNYNGRLAEFIKNYWDIDRASKRSNSLYRACQHLIEFQL